MIRLARVISHLLLLFLLLASSQGQARHESFLGFDRNQYPGDQSLSTLRQTFSYTSYWLNAPPGATMNSWGGKRALLERAGFGFLVVFNGRLYAALKSHPDVVAIGRQDGEDAAAAAEREGFPKGTVIFLDQEEGGRLLEAQRKYIHAFADAVDHAGFRAGVYCSGIAVTERNGATIHTADDLKNNAGERRIVFWVSNDACPPSPGCSMEPLSVSRSGVPFAEVWQYAQSPRRAAYTASCKRTYAADGMCYAPGPQGLHVDLNTSTSPDPSHGRTH